MRLQHAAAQLIEARGLVESAEDVFGRCLREARTMEDVSQRDLARVVGVNHSHVSRIEHGTTSLSTEIARALADTLDPLED